MMNAKQELSMNNMENVNGGALLLNRGKYYVVSNPGPSAAIYSSKTYTNLETAKAKAEKNGWSTTVYTKQEYEEAAGHKIWFCY